MNEILLDQFNYKLLPNLVRGIKNLMNILKFTLLWLVRVTLVVACSFLPQNFGMNDTLVVDTFILNCSNLISLELFALRGSGDATTLLSRPNESPSETFIA